MILIICHAQGTPHHISLHHACIRADEVTKEVACEVTKEVADEMTKDNNDDNDNDNDNDNDIMI